MTKISYILIKFFNEKIFRNTKESTSIKIQTLALLVANLKYFFRYHYGSPLKLQYPNPTVQFPLPNKWSNNQSYKASITPLNMLILQLGINGKPAGTEQARLIDQQSDRSKASIYQMKFLRTRTPIEIDQVENVISKFNINSHPIYQPDREVIFGESIVNGQHTFLLRKYGNQNFDVPQSKKIDESYRRALQLSFKSQNINEDNIKKVGLTRQIIFEKLKNRQAYSMLFEDLETVSQGNPIQNTPKIFMDNEVIQDKNILQSPYPVFININHNGKDRYICIAIGFRYKGLSSNQFKFFSPFFMEQPQKIWRLAQMHLLSAVINDFSVRVHLGIYHFTTNQYNVPIYNFLKTVKYQKQANYKSFLKFAYSVFNKGLQGNNVNGTATLIHPVPEYSIVNKVFNLSQANAISLIALNSNRVQLTQYDPVSISLDRELKQTAFSRVNLDIRLYEILKSYVSKVYQIYEIDQQSQQLLFEINKQIKNMAVGQGSQHRPLLKSKEDVIKLIVNLVFCWTGFHAHSFSAVLLTAYWGFRPTMLRLGVPPQKQDWDSYTIGSELPNAKVLMETGKLTEAATQQDQQNFLINVFEVMLFDVQREIQYKTAYSLEKHIQLQKQLIKTIADLKEFQVLVNETNEARKDAFLFTWMHPGHMQASLNI